MSDIIQEKPQTTSLINIRPEIINLDSNLNYLPNEGVNELIGKFNRMIDIEKTPSSTNRTNIFVPPLKKGQIVYVNFIGQGTVLNGKHFAIVWYVQPKEGQVVVLPMTSKKKANQNLFDLGPIHGLKSSINVVLFHQPTTVSRKSITIWTKKNYDSSGKIVSIPITLDEFQMLQFNSLYRYSQLREKDLFYKLVFEMQNKVPIQFPKELFQHLNKTIRLHINENYIIYQLPHQAESTKINLHTSDLNYEQRLTSMKNLFFPTLSK